jgi:hypothetical protein
MKRSHEVASHPFENDPPVKLILPGALWIGHAGDVRDVRALHEAGIRAVVQLAAEEPTGPFPRDLSPCRFPLWDGPGNPRGWLKLAVGTVAGLIEAGVPTLVGCGVGLSRSPAVAAAALALVRSGTPDEWLDRIARDHPLDVSPGLWGDIRRIVPTLMTPRPIDPTAPR